jgi:hypothetical protein
MPKNDTFRNDTLKLIFHGVAIADIAMNDSSSPATVLPVALHTADPGGGGSQTTDEISYTDYARVGIPRDSSGWAITGNSVSPVADIDFPVSSGGTGGTATHFSIGSGVSDKILYRGAITPPILIGTGSLPRLRTTSTVVEL